MLRNLLRDEKRKVIWCIKAFCGYTLECLAYAVADKIIISNNSDINYVKKLFPIKSDKIRLIRNFIDTKHFSPETTEGIKDSNKKALFIGRIENCKNIENMINGVGAAGCKLDLVGKGEHTQYYKAIAKKQDCDINFLGIVDNRKLPEIIRKYDFFILPSFYECSPKTLLEAMACAKVVLGTDVDGIKELINNGVTGFLCNTDADSIGRAINEIFNTEPEKLRSIAQNARKFVIKECSIEKVYKQETDIYKYR